MCFGLSGVFGPMRRPLSGSTKRDIVAAVLLLVGEVAVLKEIIRRESREPAVSLNADLRVVLWRNGKLRIDFLLGARIEIVEHHDEEHGVLDPPQTVRSELVIDRAGRSGR